MIMYDVKKETMNDPSWRRTRKKKDIYISTTFFNCYFEMQIVKEKKKTQKVIPQQRPFVTSYKCLTETKTLIENKNGDFNQC
jgi:hypothetical protein